MTYAEALQYKPSPYVFFCIGKEPVKPKILIKIQDIEKAVCMFYGVQPESLKYKNRARKLVKTRQTICYLCVRLTKTSLKGIGRYFGQDHTTVIHANRTVQNLMDTEPEYKADVEYLLNLFNK